MSSSIPTDPAPDESRRPQQEPMAADDLLPPVEPPSAGFIIQLFVVPMVIVAIVVAFGLLIQWLADSGEVQPDQMVKALRSSNQARFQQAEKLSHMLQAEGRYPGLKENQELVQKLGVLLTEMVESGSDAEGEVTMRVFLSRALGEFHVDDGMDALIAAAGNDPVRDVRRNAVNAIAVLAGTLPTLDPPRSADSPALRSLMEKLADGEDELLRSEAAFTIGVLASDPQAAPEYRELLAQLANDFFPDASYNAALGLARVGDLRAAPVVAQMLDLKSIAASVESERASAGTANEAIVAGMQANKRNVLIKNALTAVDLLLQQNKPSDLPQVSQALKKFVAGAPEVKAPSPIPEALIAEGKELLGKF